MIFVGGAPRSGTTLVQRLLNTHPDIYGGPEIDIIPSIVALYRDSASRITSGRISSWLEEDECKILFRRLIHDLFVFKKSQINVTLVSEKTPANILVFYDLMVLCPEARFIWVIRDPRAVIASMKEVAVRQKQRTGRASGFIRSVATACDYVETCIQAGLLAMESNPKLFILNYECLVKDSDLVLAGLFESLGRSSISTDELMGSKFEVPLAKNSWIDWYSEEELEQGIKTTSVCKWKEILSQCEIRYINARFRKYRLLATQYDFEPNPRMFESKLLSICFRARSMTQAIFSIVRSVVSKVGRKLEQ